MSVLEIELEMTVKFSYLSSIRAVNIVHLTREK
jgi:hypothetical protein